MPGRQADEMPDHDYEPDHDDEKFDNWPIIGSVVPAGPIGFVERWGLETQVEEAIGFIRAKIEELGIDPSYVDEENTIPFSFLVNTMLKCARTSEQVCNMADGYLAFCARECGQFRSPLLDDYRYNVQVIDMSFFGPAKMRTLKELFGEKRFRTLDQYSRNPALHAVTHGLAREPIDRYGRELFCDGAYFVMSDPTKVDHDAIETGETVVDRNVPDNKRMTKEKLARLLQLPDLEKFIIADRDMNGPFLGSSLAIIAEYFCENDGAVFLNGVTPDAIGRWLLDKFARHSPPLELAYYVWARFQQTEFEEAANFIETYIIGLHEKNEPWLFEASGVRPGVWRCDGQIFAVYTAALQKLQQNPDDPNYHRLLEILPGREIGMVFTKSKNQKYRESADRYLKSLKIPLNHVTSEYTEERFKANPPQMFIDILSESDAVTIDKWEAYEGFEILDPFGVKMLQKSLRAWAIHVFKEKIFKSLEKFSLTDLLIFRNQVATRVTNAKTKAALETSIATLIEKAYGETLSQETSIADLTAMAKGKEADMVTAIPSLAALPPEMRRVPASGRLPGLAEAALITKAFAGVRGSDAVIKFLLEHRDTMRPAELISPFPDAPNLEIIRIYGDSPNLLLLLSMSTILMYLGYRYEEILIIINELVEKIEKNTRPEIGTVGIELEQVGGIKDRVIALDHFGELFNVLPAGNDRGCNELTTPPSTSSYAQAMLMSIIADQANGYIDTAAMWKAEATAGHPMSSIHVNMGLPAELGASPMEFAGMVDPIIKATWLAHGGDIQSGMAKGVARRWAHGALLDTIGGIDSRTKLEIRNLALEKDGSHATEIDDIFMIAAACMQHARTARGLKVSSSGSAMGDIFEEFRGEVERLKFSLDEAESARELLAKYAARVKTELKL